MEQLNKNKIIIAVVLLILLIIIFIINNIPIDVKLFDLTENEPLKQVYARNQERFIEDIMPQSEMTNEQYNDFLSNLDNYIVYSLRCNIDNKSDKKIKLQYEFNQENMWIDTVTMTNGNEEIDAKNNINKNIRILIKMDGKTKEEIEKDLEKLEITIHIYNMENKEIKTLKAHF